MKNPYTEFVEACLAQLFAKEDMVRCPGYYCHDGALCTGQCSRKRKRRKMTSRNAIDNRLENEKERLRKSGFTEIEVLYEIIVNLSAEIDFLWSKVISGAENN